jgi:hypothetical protein
MECKSMIQLKDLDMEMTEVLNNELGLVTGADGSGFDFGYSGTPNYSSNNLSQFNTSYSSLSPDPRSSYVNSNDVFTNAWMAPIGSGSKGTGSTVVGIQGGDGNGNVYAVRQGGFLSWKNQSGTGAAVGPGVFALSLGFGF